MIKAQAVIEERKKAMASLHPPEPKPPATNGARKAGIHLSGKTLPPVAVLVHSEYLCTYLSFCFIITNHYWTIIPDSSVHLLHYSMYENIKQL